MKNRIFIFVVGLALISFADNFSAQRADVLALARLTNAPAMQDAAGFSSAKNLKAIYFDALDWKGKPTKVFAWLGLPENRTGKVPGIVLVHGGGGTAFKEWVKLWNDHGFAAISIAVEGQTDERESSKVWKKHEWAGPARNGIYGDSAEPLKDQWMFHAVADTVLANSLLRSLPEVDADKVGLMGISWGGVITSTAIGIDDRFAFAIPTYGCGHLFDAANQYGRALGNNELYKQVWDPMVRLNRVKMPVLWFSWPEDQHFPLDKQAACYHAMPGPVLVALIPGMQHGHAPAWNRSESYAFAKSVVEEGIPWCRQIECRGSSGEGRVVLESAKPLERAVLISTTSRGVTGSRKWTETSAVLTREGDLWIASVPLPAGTTAWFINAHSSGLTVSSAFQEVLD
jgi:dienelactone hydrolase